jgi:hypothetical protein
MSPASQIGKRLIEAVADMLPAHEAVRPVSNGIEWGKSGARQRLWWEAPVDEAADGSDSVRIRILTEVMPLPEDPAEWSEDVRGTILWAASANVWGGLMLAEEMNGCLCFGAAVTVHEDNKDQLPTVLFHALAAQAVIRDALFDSSIVPEVTRLSETESAGDIGEILASMHKLMSGASSAVSDGVESDIGVLIEQFQDFPCLVCTSSKMGLSAEFPYGEKSSLLRIDAAADHPLFGASVRLVLLLPLKADESPLTIQAILEMNRKEQPVHELAWSFGSWNLDRLKTPRLGYRLWIPYPMFQPGLLVKVGNGMVDRARRYCLRMQGMSFEDAYPLALKHAIGQREQLVKEL